MTVHSQGAATSAPQDAPLKSAGLPPKAPAAPAGPSQPSPRGGRKQLPTGWLPYLLIAPAVLSLAVLLVYPLIKNVILSFQDINKIEFIQRKYPSAGFDNYTQLLGDSNFWTVVLRSFGFTLANVVLIMAIGSLIGLLLNKLGKKMRLVLSMALVMAWAMPIVASVQVFYWLFDEQFGVMNWVMRTAGFSGYEQHNWFETGLSTLTIVTVLVVWGSIPFVALNMYAALTTVGAELYEAARMDGANGWQTFWKVVFPQLKPFFLITTFLEVIWVFKAFTQVYAMNKGGPDRASEILPVFAFVEGQSQSHYGLAAAISVLTILILIVIMSFYFRLILKQEEEQ
ncbi:carbohydrate ABC transporter permease [Streptomyces lavendulae]|uniref:Inner membrane ABC transporter permease protein YcjO n=1 Tax=Streptomyces lavendulae subsp. lavendulae TaxID=58340 RepID=A0A2K8PCT9_STRLA|nr:sugar ABC transporter permease [Streptomyces lavendulae]ATZ24546.1 Inner membrane ABC transporter permease protein YcjO [Streptomyces lavendulae subsp. lavendulae]QUQ54376.1 Diacetylchitobiose uptake system permease protein DasB [Streptomyces lavendulae subsp. lavendulae]GLV80877.1 sugar ABC transporter permease [Streptomyces lavendulae subsp. lavendulae]GLV99619.1 sugar ABC transporter permease [Streptomyces lavendulae subsp. lavendulae]